MKYLQQFTAVAFGLCFALGCGSFTARADERVDGSALRQPLPERWQYISDHTQPSPSTDKWWLQFGDSTLNMLITRAETNNFNVAAALKRIDVARQQVGIAASAYYPTISASAGWTRAQSAGAISRPVIRSTTTDYFSAGLTMNWEVDVFGRVRAKVNAQKKAVAVSRAEYDGVIVSLCADVAKAYLQLRTYQQQYRVAREHIASQEKILRIAQARFEAGIGDMLEVTQAKVVLYTTQSTIPGLESSIYTVANSLATLTGVYPNELVPQLLTPEPLPSDFGTPDVGIPADLLRRRPDVVEAEAQLAEYAALVGVAKKDFLPTLSIEGTIGTAAHKIGDMFGDHSLQYSVAPTLSWTIFDGFVRNRSLAEARQQLEIATDNYNLTVQTAVEEVNNAIARYNASRKECELLERLIEQSEKELSLSVDLYKQGLVGFNEVADAQMSYLENQNSLVASQGNVLSAVVSLYQALGGGY